ncbi:MAG: hypothetical protein ACRCS7_02475 [Tannerellaceae bacterium]
MRTRGTMLNTNSREDDAGNEMTVAEDISEQPFPMNSTEQINTEIQTAMSAENIPLFPDL